MGQIIMPGQEPMSKAPQQGADHFPDIIEQARMERMGRFQYELRKLMESTGVTLVPVTVIKGGFIQAGFDYAFQEDLVKEAEAAGMTIDHGEDKGEQGSVQ